jgi:hypothetical protein
MKLNPRIWYPIAALASLANVVAVWFAAIPAEPLHATVHAALAVAFGLWAQRLKTRLRPGTLTGENELEVAALREEVGALGHELGELQERLDFAERLLSQQRDTERMPRPS